MIKKKIDKKPTSSLSIYKKGNNNSKQNGKEKKRAYLKRE